MVGDGEKAGIYPFDGPVPHTMVRWKYIAPALDFIGPDLYFDNYEKFVNGIEIRTNHSSSLNRDATRRESGGCGLPTARIKR